MCDAHFNQFVGDDKFNTTPTKHCRWCGKSYQATKSQERDGFCSPECENLLQQAVKKWIAEKDNPKNNPKTRKQTGDNAENPAIKPPL